MPRRQTVAIEEPSARAPKAAHALPPQALFLANGAPTTREGRLNRALARACAVPQPGHPPWTPPATPLRPTPPCAIAEREVAQGPWRTPPSIQPTLARPVREPPGLAAPPSNTSPCARPPPTRVHQYVPCAPKNTAPRLHPSDPTPPAGAPTARGLMEPRPQGPPVHDHPGPRTTTPRTPTPGGRTWPFRNTSWRGL